MSQDYEALYAYPATTIRYADSDKTLIVRQIYKWERATVGDLVNGSSGPKEYIWNQIRAIFDAQPEIKRIVMVRGAGGPTISPFILMQADDNCWFDITGKQVVSVSG